MKIIRYLSALLLIVSGFLHAWPISQGSTDPNALPMLGFGVAYFIIGFFLLLDRGFSRILGVIFPLIGLGVGFGVVGLKNWDSLLTFLFVIDAVVAICCFILILNKQKTH